MLNAGLLSRASVWLVGAERAAGNPAERLNVNNEMATELIISGRDLSSEYGHGPGEMTTSCRLNLSTTNPLQTLNRLQHQSHRKVQQHPAPRETLENPGHSRDNGPVIAGQDWVDGRQTTRLLGLRAHHGQEADQTGVVSLQCHVPEICEQSRCSFSRIESAVAVQLKGAVFLL